MAGIKVVLLIHSTLDVISYTFALKFHCMLFVEIFQIGTFKIEILYVSTIIDSMKVELYEKWQGVT